MAFCVLSFLILPVLLLPLAGASFLLYYSRSLPDFGPLKQRHVNATTTVYSDEDEVIPKFLMDHRIPISYERIPRSLIQAFIAAEDAEFFKHGGVSSKSIDFPG